MKTLLSLRKKLKKSGVVGYETEKLSFISPKVRKYTPDFVVKFNDGRVMYIEYKGYFRYEDQAKMRDVVSSNPQLDIRMVFPNDGLVYGKRSKMRYSDWCKKYNIKFCIGEIPDSWLRGFE